MTPDIEMDMDYDPEEDDKSVGEDDDESPSHNGPFMMWVGFVVMGIFTLWDYFGASPPSLPTYGILGVWLMLGACVSISEVVYR